MVKNFLKVVWKRQFTSFHTRDYRAAVPGRNFVSIVPKRDLQTIPDTSERRLYTVAFTHWGQTDITLGSVLETFGGLP